MARKQFSAEDVQTQNQSKCITNEICNFANFCSYIGFKYIMKDTFTRITGLPDSFFTVTPFAQLNQGQSGDVVISFKFVLNKTIDDETSFSCMDV
jgi:hypothetical protein